MSCVIESVIGFNLNRVVLNKDGSPIPVGVKTTFPDVHREQMNSRPQDDTRFFTNFNHRLLAKVRDYKSRNL